MVQSGAKDEAVERADSGTQPSARLALGAHRSTLRHRGSGSGSGRRAWADTRHGSGEGAQDKAWTLRTSTSMYKGGGQVQANLALPSGAFPTSMVNCFVLRSDEWNDIGKLGKS